MYGCIPPSLGPVPVAVTRSTLGVAVVCALPAAVVTVTRLT
jgi:hypothetical protein